jgi:peptidyl-prolyl cis-trans isomerase C
MQRKLSNCLSIIILSFIVICWGTLIQAAENSTTPVNKTKTNNTTAPASTAAVKSATATPGKVASVNGTPISQELFDRTLAYQQQIAAMKGVTITNEQMSELKYEVLEGLISNELLYQESQKRGIKVEEKEINEAYETQKQKAQFKTDAEFQEALNKTKQTLSSYKAQLKQGLTLDHFIKTKFTDNATVSDSEAKKYYDDYPDYFKQPAQVKVSHIMIKVASNAVQANKDEAKTKMDQIMKRLKAGEDFATVARDVSEDTGSKANGGDLDYISKGQTPKSFEDAAFALKKGEISDIVKTDTGYHIIKLTDKKDAKTISYEEAKNDIITSLKNSKVNNSVSKYITELKNKATITSFPISK